MLFLCSTGGRARPGAPPVHRQTSHDTHRCHTHDPSAELQSAATSGIAPCLLVRFPLLLLPCPLHQPLPLLPPFLLRAVCR